MGTLFRIKQLLSYQNSLLCSWFHFFLSLLFFNGFCFCCQPPSFPFSLWRILLLQSFYVPSFLSVLLSLLFHIQTIFQLHMEKLTGIGPSWKWRREEHRSPCLFQSRDWEGDSLMRDQGTHLHADCNRFSNICIWTSLQLSFYGCAPPHTSGKMTIVTPVEIIAVLKNFKGHEEWVLRHIHLGTNK